MANRISVIAVHGMNTTSPETWRAYKNKKDDSNGCVNWLSDIDMLPSAIPSAQIWIFHYNTSWLSDAPAERLSNLADKLLLVLYEAFFDSGGEHVSLVISRQISLECLLLSRILLAFVWSSLDPAMEV
jgi:hypothetical protein